jgi:hypothetical protein
LESREENGVEKKKRWNYMPRTGVYNLVADSFSLKSFLGTVAAWSGSGCSLHDWNAV